MKLKAPFPAFGGKSTVAATVWEWLGDPDNYIEPFANSAAVLLLRPHAPRVETINDLDPYIANFWRATGPHGDAEKVAEYADSPVNETDLHSRHRWLVFSDDAVAFREKMKTDPHYYDAKIAGWWCWGLCCWIGSGWCVHPSWEGRGNAAAPPRGVQCGPNGKRPSLGNGNNGAMRGQGVHKSADAGTCAQRRDWLLDWFCRLRDRLRTVRVCCGDWLRVCDSPSVTTGQGKTGIFFDPPYGAGADRTANIYAKDSLKVAADVRAYCLERGDDPLMRICLAGYAGEGHEVLEAAGWDCVAWQASGGYGSRSSKGKANAKRERLWFSPACAKKPTLYDVFEEEKNPHYPTFDTVSLTGVGKRQSEPSQEDAAL